MLSFAILLITLSFKVWVTHSKKSKDVDDCHSICRTPSLSVSRHFACARHLCIEERRETSQSIWMSIHFLIFLCCPSLVMMIETHEFLSLSRQIKRLKEKSITEKTSFRDFLSSLRHLHDTKEMVMRKSCSYSRLPDTYCGLTDWNKGLQKYYHNQDVHGRDDKSWKKHIHFWQDRISRRPLVCLLTITDNDDGKLHDGCDTLLLKNSEKMLRKLRKNFKKEDAVGERCSLWHHPWTERSFHWMRDPPSIIICFFHRNLNSLDCLFRTKRVKMRRVKREDALNFHSLTETRDSFAWVSSQSCETRQDMVQEEKTCESRKYALL